MINKLKNDNKIKIVECRIKKLTPNLMNKERYVVNIKIYNYIFNKV